MLLDAVLLPFQLAVLCLLHVIFASIRLGKLVRQLPSLLAPHLPAILVRIYPQTAVDKSQWKKIPRHLAVVFVPGQRWRLDTWWPRRTSAKQRAMQDEHADLGKLIQDLKRLLKWCETLEIQDLSVYDEAGLLRRHADTIAASLSASFPVLPTVEHTDSFTTIRIASPRLSVKRKDDLHLLPGGEVDSGCGVSEGLPDGINTPPTLSPPCVTLNLLSRQSGRPQLARIARGFATARKKGLYDTEPLTTEAVIESIEASTFAEPDLLIVLGGPYLRLHGFPPWEIRLTEIYHHPSPGWLPPPKLSREVLYSALDLYGGAQMRMGR